MLIRHLDDYNCIETSFSDSYNNYDIVVRLIVPFRSKPWFTCYINKTKDFTDEELDSIPNILITYNDIYSKSWVDSSLAGKSVIGWDYNHGFEEENNISIHDIVNDAYKVIDYLETTYGGK